MAVQDRAQEIVNSIRTLVRELGRDAKRNDRLYQSFATIVRELRDELAVLRHRDGLSARDYSTRLTAVTALLEQNGFYDLAA